MKNNLSLILIKDTNQQEIQIGVTGSGLLVFQNNVKVNTFSWAKIVKISFKRRHFFIQLRREGVSI
jgi:tyrosine-protein phosphatase non-receptor type 4